jgi:hypothetical protein
MLRFGSEYLQAENNYMYIFTIQVTELSAAFQSCRLLYYTSVSNRIPLSLEIITRVFKNLKCF